MMGRLDLYSKLALKDVFRLWSATQLQVIIIAGICLPILILLGLKNGHVAELREELATSPVGRQVIFWSSQSGDLLSDSTIKDILASVKNAELIIPESQRVVFLVPRSNSSDENEADNEEVLHVEPVPLTLYSTAPGDPILGQFGADVLTGKALEIVLSESIAKTMGFAIGDTINVEIKRQLGSEREDYRLQFLLKGVLQSGQEGEGASIGYADLSVMKLLERYGTGVAVPEWNIPAMASLSARDVCEEMLLFCFKGVGTDLTEDDFDFFKSRGLEATQVEDPVLITLYGMLKDSAIEELNVYKIQRLDRENGRIAPIRDTPQLLVRNTDADDDFIVRWNEPLELKINGDEFLLVGLTLPRVRQTGGWIKGFLRDGADWFTYQESVDDPFSVRASFSLPTDESEKLHLQFDEDVLVEMTNLSEWDPGKPRPDPKSLPEIPSRPAEPGSGQEAAPVEGETGQSEEKPAQDTAESEKSVADSPGVSDPEASGITDNPASAPTGDDGIGPRVLIVPVTLVSYIHMYRAGLVEFDEQGKRFTEIPAELDYTKARLYTSTIDDVPAAVTLLASRNYAVLSESSRIAEIQEQDQSLQMLVMVVAIGVFVFGVITVFSVLVDSTDRKRGTIGILRVMGMTRFGVFFMVLFRALTIGLLAAVLCSGVGYVLAYLLGSDFTSVDLLSWKPTISVLLKPQDIGLVALGAVLCASLGAILPALKASALDPFEAIMEGRFH